MFELIRAHQLNIMLMLCGACGILIFLLIFTRFLTKSRKAILILMELTAFFLLWFDRLAYIYAGDPGHKAYIMVRVSNFAVFFLTSGIVFCFNLYIISLLTNEGKLASPPKRLIVVGVFTAIGMLMAVISAFTDLYYYFDEVNQYHRGQGFLIAYIIPVLCPITQFTAVRKYRQGLSKLIFVSLNLYIFIPILCGIAQIFIYGLSIVNMSLVAVSVSSYIFMYLDLNDTVRHMHEIEIQNMKGEQKRMKKLFDQTATAFVSAVEKKDDFAKGNAVRIAGYAKRIAAMAGKSEEECEKAYYTALLHDVGLIGIPDSVIKNDADPGKTDYEEIRKKPLIGAEILSSITEYPYLSQGARYSHERYNGTGYPEGLKGEEIPEVARIVGVADSYVTKITKKRYRDANPRFMAREAFIRGAGEEYDPDFAMIMVKIIDSETNEGAGDNDNRLETEIVCSEYRENISIGIPVDTGIRKISFDCKPSEDPGIRFSAPSIVLFDAYDGRTHDSAKEIEKYGYLEYGEIWFDKYSVTTVARNIEEKKIDEKLSEEGADGYQHYEIIAGRYDDHLKLVMKSKDYAKEVIVALPSGSKASYIGLTGENCRIVNIGAEPTGETVGPEDIPRIAQYISYIEHFESDLKNIQIDQTRSVATKGVEIKDRLIIRFHTMSLPIASIVWQCPYILLYTSDDGSVGGPGYKEFNVIKLDGEDQGETEYAYNRFVMKKTDSFPGWDEWLNGHKKGLNCEISFERKGNQVVLKTETLGVRIENTSILKEENVKVYVALTGDQVALTDIRVL